jgi:tRNA dimethylallyltransferase
MLEGSIPPAELRDRGIFATRQFAKRQLTWFNSLPYVALLDSLAAETGAAVMARIENFIAT